MIELVWDGALAGTATSSNGATVHVGENAAWSAEDLVALSVAACLMLTTVRLAAADNVAVLGYVVAAQLTTSSPEMAVRVRACLVVPSHVQRADAAGLCGRAVALSPVAALLGDRLDYATEISTIDDASEV